MWRWSGDYLDLIAMAGRKSLNAVQILQTQKLTIGQIL